MYEMKQIDVIASSTCDLRCDYCYLIKNKEFGKYNKEVQDAWLSGKYVQTLKNVAKKLQCSFEDTEVFQFWGGEPLISVKNMTESMKELVSYMPNLQHFLVPTNWYHTNPYDLCDFLQGINDNLITDINNKPHFNIQMSIDGTPDDEFLKNGHNASWDNYLNNFNTLLDLFETRTFDKLAIDFSISGTTSQDRFLKIFNNYEALKKHIEYWEDINKYAIQRAKNISGVEIFINSKINFPNIAIPTETGIEEALEILKIVKTAQYMLYQEGITYGQADTMYKTIFPSTSEHFMIAPNQECVESNQISMVIAPDGTITQCPNAFLEHFDSYRNQILKDGDFNRYKTALISSYDFFNPLTATEEEIKDHNWYNIMGGIRDTYTTYINLGFSMAQEMAISHQIDYNYAKNPELLLKHIFAAPTMMECHRENINVTKIPQLSDHNFFRRWLNGYIEAAYGARKTEIDYVIKQVLTKKDLDNNTQLKEIFNLELN